MITIGRMSHGITIAPSRTMREVDYDPGYTYNRHHYLS